MVGGQTVTQRIPEPAPGEADDPRLPPTGTQNGGGRCQQDWQFYEEQQDIFWNGKRAKRSVGAMACVVTTNDEERPRLRFGLPGLKDADGLARCHLIGHKLNGSNKDRRNFVPCNQDPTNNSWMYHKVEAKIQHQVENLHNPVLMSSHAIYPVGSDTPHPDVIKVLAVGENGWTCQAEIPNTNTAGAASNGVTFTGC